MSTIERWREALILALTVVLITVAVYMMFALAVTFKTAVEFPNRLKTSLSRTH